MKIMIVDDSKHIQNLVEGMLIQHDHDVVKADNGKIAADILKEGNVIDLILLDWNMPEVNGPELLEMIRDQNLTDCPVLMMTTENRIEQISKAISLGAREYITKPFTEDILFSKIDIAVNN